MRFSFSLACSALVASASGESPFCYRPDALLTRPALSPSSLSPHRHLPTPPPHLPIARLGSPLVPKPSPPLAPRRPPPSSVANPPRRQTASRTSRTSSRPSRTAALHRARSLRPGCRLASRHGRRIKLWPSAPALPTRSRRLVSALRSCCSCGGAEEANLLLRS